MARYLLIPGEPFVYGVLFCDSFKELNGLLHTETAARLVSIDYVIEGVPAIKISRFDYNAFKSRFTHVHDIHSTKLFQLIYNYRKKERFKNLTADEKILLEQSPMLGIYEN